MLSSGFIMRAFQNKTPTLYFFVGCQDLPLSADGFVKHTEIVLGAGVCVSGEILHRNTRHSVPVRTQCESTTWPSME